MTRPRLLILLFLSFVCSIPAQAEEVPDAYTYLSSCLALERVQQLTLIHLTALSRIERPQPGCSYNDSDILSRQTHIIYSRDPAYTTAFNIPDLMQPVTGLGRFAEFEAEAGRLYVNLGRDGIVFEGRSGKKKMTLTQLQALAQEVLSVTSR